MRHLWVAGKPRLCLRNIPAVRSARRFENDGRVRFHARFSKNSGAIGCRSYERWRAHPLFSWPPRTREIQAGRPSGIARAFWFESIKRVASTAAWREIGAWRDDRRRNLGLDLISPSASFDSTHASFSLNALNTETVTAFARDPTDQIRGDAERLSHIILEMQRCFVLHLCKELAPGNVSFPQFFLLAYLDHKEVLTMSAIAQKMGHTTAAASGLVARLENTGFVVRSVAREDRRKVMVCITPKGSALVRRIREEMVGNIVKIMEHLTTDEQKAWLHIYSKIYDFCQSK